MEPPTAGFVEDVEPEVVTPRPREVPLRSAATYAVAAALPRAVGFLLLPVYTRALAPDEYGVLSLLLAIAAGVAILLTLGLDLAIFRGYFDLEEDPARQREFVDSVWRFLIIFPIAAGALVGAVAWALVDGAGPLKGPDLLVAVVAAALAVAATTVPLAVLRAAQRLRDYLTVTAVTTFANAGLTLLFVVGFGWGVRGWLGAGLLANAVALVAATLVVPWHPMSSFDRLAVQRSVRFGLPLVPHFFSHWALQLADRAVIAGIVSADALGVYSLAANLALPALILVQSLNQGFMPTYARAGTHADRREELAQVVFLQAALVTLICVAGALLAPPLVSLIAPPAYAQAGSLVGWIVLGYGFLGLYFIPMSGASLGAGRSGYVWVATMVGAATNIGLLYEFVPRHGLTAAAVASAVGYGVLLVAIFIWSRRGETPVRYLWQRLAGVFAAGGAIYALGVATSASTGGVAFAARMAWLLVLGIVIFALARRPTRRDRQCSRLG